MGMWALRKVRASNGPAGRPANRGAVTVPGGVTVLHDKFMFKLPESGVTGLRAQTRNLASSELPAATAAAVGRP